MAFAVGESVKPKTQENVNAEIKLRCFSLTLLDGLHGMVCYVIWSKLIANFLEPSVYILILF